MTFDWWTLLLQVVNFLILVWLLQRFLYAPVKAVIAKRRALVEQTLADAKAERAAVEAEKAALDKARADLDAQRQSILDAAQKDAEAKRKAAMEAAAKQADALLAKARDEAAAERAADVASLKGAIADAAVAIARRILAGTTGGDLDAAFRTRILAKLDALDAEARAPGPVRIITASPLANAQEAAWREALKARGFDKAPDFALDTTLVAGAELRLPRGDVRLAWADQIEEARDLLDAKRVGA